jgi:hypothetical protein
VLELGGSFGLQWFLEEFDGMDGMCSFRLKFRMNV